MRIKSFHLTTQGASHIKKGKECQDASESYFDENCAIAIVCDGHGGDDYVRSALGSSFAASVAKSNILSFIANVDKDELKRHYQRLIQNLQASIISAWNSAIRGHFEENPLTESEIAVLSPRAKRKYLQEDRIESAYGTTLIAVVITKDYWFGIHIGDGKCVAINPEGKFVQPIPWDEKCFLNSTTSICDSDALSRFRLFFSEKLPVAVFVGSDGVDDCFSSDQQLNNLYKTILYSFATSEFDGAVNDLSEYLPRLSAKGSGDDVSIAAVLDMDAIGDIEAVKEFDREKEKARVEENARIAAQKAEEERLRVEAERAAQLKQKEAKRQDTAILCSKCRAPLQKGALFCSFCGTKVSEANTSTSPFPSNADGVATQSELQITKVVPFGNTTNVVEPAEEEIETCTNEKNTEPEATDIPAVPDDASVSGDQCHLSESEESQKDCASAKEKASSIPIEGSIISGAGIKRNDTPRIEPLQLEELK